MLATVIKATNPSSTVSNKDEFVQYFKELLGEELAAEWAYVNSDAQLDGFLTPLFKDTWDNNSKTWTSELYHESVSDSKDFQLSFLNNKLIRQAEMKLADAGWNIELKTQPVSEDMNGVESIGLNHISNLHLIRPSRRP